MNVILSQREHVGIIELSRPETKNALDPGTLLELYEAWNKHKNDEQIRRELEIAFPIALSAGAKEGPRAFREKRPPEFTGK
jgi:1,4-dihydroxy-2-naphthoyl-CoA synthase